MDIGATVKVSNPNQPNYLLSGSIVDTAICPEKWGSTSMSKVKFSAGEEWYWDEDLTIEKKIAPEQLRHSS